jgi:bifunctional non-homologous end joining protein LigD
MLAMAAIPTARSFGGLSAPLFGARPANDAPDLLAHLAEIPLDIELSHLDQVIDPTHHLTKGELIAYLGVVAEHILPHIGGRPLTAVRCPGGNDKPCFCQKTRLPGSHASIVPLVLRDRGVAETYMEIYDLAGLIALGQLGTFELHTWATHGDQAERPDLVVFELDADEETPWQRVAAAALGLRNLLAVLGLDCFVKTTGGRGLHVEVPIERRLGWSDVKRFADAVSRTLELARPVLYTTIQSKAARHGKIFISSVHERGATFLAPYSPRALPGMPVAMPIAWDLVMLVDPAAFTIRTVPGILEARAIDPWAGIGTLRQAITPAAWRAITERT